MYIHGGFDRFRGRILADLWCLGTLGSGNRWEWHELTSSTDPVPLAQHTVVAHSGMLLIFGGRAGGSGETLGDLWCVEPQTSGRRIASWNRIHTTGEPPCPRSGHSATMVGSSMFVLFGSAGKYEYLSDMYSLSCEEMVWTCVSVGCGPESRALHSCTGWEGRLYVFGGFRRSHYRGHLPKGAKREKFEEQHFGDLWEYIVDDDRWRMVSMDLTPEDAFPLPDCLPVAPHCRGSHAAWIAPTDIGASLIVAGGNWSGKSRLCGNVDVHYPVGAFAIALPPADLTAHVNESWILLSAQRWPEAAAVVQAASWEALMFGGYWKLEDELHRYSDRTYSLLGEIDVNRSSLNLVDDVVMPDHQPVTPDA